MYPISLVIRRALPYLRHPLPRLRYGSAPVALTATRPISHDLGIVLLAHSSEIRQPRLRAPKWPYFAAHIARRMRRICAQMRLVNIAQLIRGAGKSPASLRAMPPEVTTPSIRNLGQSRQFQVYAKKVATGFPHAPMRTFLRRFLSIGEDRESCANIADFRGGRQASLGRNPKRREKSGESDAAGDLRRDRYIKYRIRRRVSVGGCAPYKFRKCPHQIPPSAQSRGFLLPRAHSKSGRRTQLNR